jgi:hypothetical protein
MPQRKIDSGDGAHLVAPLLARVDRLLAQIAARDERIDELLAQVKALNARIAELEAASRSRRAPSPTCLPASARQSQRRPSGSRQRCVRAR